jgi:isoleucyl-tRNA synthetase
VFIVSQVELAEGNTGDLEVEVGQPLGSKCERCWLALESVGGNAEHPTLCDRCVSAIS